MAAGPPLRGSEEEAVIRATAAALAAAKEPLRLIERDVPPPAAGEVTLKLEACALGLSDWDVADFSFEARIADLEAVVDDAGFDRFTR